MCGIAGIFAYAAGAASVDPDQLRRMQERMVRRGPDGHGLWMSEDGRVGLAHRRLAIIDLSEAGHQPMVDPQTGHQIVFNGEIYNYRELRARLQAQGVSFQSGSDTEVLLKLYGLMGSAMLGLLRGMFAFAIWDASRYGVFLARDPLGIKPLYVADDGSTVRFASQVKALREGLPESGRPDPAGHVGFLLWGSVPEPFTLYEDVRALPAGTHAWYGADGRRTQGRFFSLAEAFAQPDVSQPAVRNADEAREQLVAAITDSVRHHLVADVPVGIFLSAGLDSSLLAACAALACGTQPSGLQTFTLGFKEFAGTEADEVPMAEAVADRLGTQHRTVWVGQDDFAAEHGRLLEAMDQPSIDGVNSYFVCKAAREAGLKVALAGLGGDELFAGYSHFRSIPSMVRMLRPLGWLPGAGAGLRRVLQAVGGSRVPVKACGMFEFGSSIPSAYFLRRAMQMPWELAGRLEPDFLREGLRRLDTHRALAESAATLRGARSQISALEMAWYMRNQLLRDADWASMAHSLEVRVPLVDVPLLQAVNRLSWAGHAPSKLDMIAGVAHSLPPELLTRPKTGFQVPVRQWLLRGAAGRADSAVPGLRGWAYHLYQDAFGAQLPLRA